jgi:hypothetical protein
MWNVKTVLISVIIEATVTNTKSLRKYLNNVGGKQDIKELEKTATMGTAHTMRKVLM